MRKVWWVADSVVSPLGFTTEENFSNVSEGRTGVATETTFGIKPVCVARCKTFQNSSDNTQFELLAQSALQELSSQIDIPKERTLFILSTTKGNIEVLEKDQPNHARIHLHQVSKYLAKQVGFSHHVVVSNACTSGVVALILAKRQIENGNYDHAVVLGVDAVSRFVVSGFQSLNALSDTPCKPFDATRTGINLGEAASAVLVSNNPNLNNKHRIRIAGGAITNDANHISGPSKTGEELAMAVTQTMKQTGMVPLGIDFISAHGTATQYNDEMESKAFYLAGLSETPLHSLKGNFGHTLGAAGVLESALSVRSLIHQKILPSKGFTTSGVSRPLNIIRNSENKTMQTVLKTSSGFGGCNAALILQLES